MPIGTLTIEVPTEVRKGEVVEININVADVVIEPRNNLNLPPGEFTSAGFKLNYDDDVIEIEIVKKGPIVPKGGALTQNLRLPGTLRASVFMPGAVNIVSPGTLFVLFAKIIGDPGDATDLSFLFPTRISEQYPDTVDAVLTIAEGAPQAPTEVSPFDAIMRHFDSVLISNEPIFNRSELFRAAADDIHASGDTPDNMQALELLLIARDAAVRGAP